MEKNINRDEEGNTLAYRLERRIDALLKDAGFSKRMVNIESNYATGVNSEGNTVFFKDLLPKRLPSETVEIALFNGDGEQVEFKMSQGKEVGNE